MATNVGRHKHLGLILTVSPEETQMTETGNLCEKTASTGQHILVAVHIFHNVHFTV